MEIFSKDPDYKFKYPTVVRHQGMPIVLALRKPHNDAENGEQTYDIYYRVLAPDPAQPKDDDNWSDILKLSFPKQIRPAGMSLVTVDLKTAEGADEEKIISTSEQTADAPFQAVSDGKHVYLFRQSKDSTLYVDRFVFDPAALTLNPTWEARFRRSLKRDLPASRKDTLGARDMEGQPFFEPTTELRLIRDLQDGRFCVLLLPGPLPSQWRWQILVTNTKGEIDSYSICRGEDGLFNIVDVQRCSLKWAGTEQRFLTGPAALQYMQQEETLDEYGREQRVKRGARVMVAAPAGSSRYALEFDGVDDYVSLGNPDGLQIEGDFTIEAWVKRQAIDGSGDIISNGADGIYLRIQDGHYQIGMGVDKGASYKIPQADNNVWVHLAGVYDSQSDDKSWSLFHNGEKLIPEEMAPNKVSSDPVSNAQEWAIGRSFAGQINDVRLWKRARTEVIDGIHEIKKDMHRQLAGNEKDLVGYWSFEEGAGDIVYDRASGNDGRLHLGYSLALDGIDDYVEIPNYDSINFDKDEDFTVTVWIKTAPEQENTTVIDNEIVEKWSDTGGYPFVIRYLNRTYGDAGKIVAARYDGSRNPKIISNTVVNDGRFHHIAFVKKDKTLYLYIDGSLEGTTEDTTTRTTTNNSPLYVGIRGGWHAPFAGQINHLRIWNRALSIKEIREDIVKPASEVGGTVGNWAFDEGSGDTVHDQANGNDGQLDVGSGDDTYEKWRMNPQWVAVPPIAILDFAVSRLGTLALIGDMEDHSQITLTLNDHENAARLPIPVLEEDEDSGKTPMPPITVDKKNMTVSAGLLNFTHSVEKPFLLDGADGLVHLYFRGDDGQFFVAQYDTLTARAEYSLPLDGTGTISDGPQLHFTARHPGGQMNDYKIVITGEPKDHPCQVTISKENGISETWKDVPRKLDAFLAVLNGAATTDKNDPLLVHYNYDDKVTRVGTPDLTGAENPFLGSILFGVGVDNPPDDTGATLTVGNGEAAVKVEPPDKDFPDIVEPLLGLDCAWTKEPQGKALKFKADDEPISLPHDRLAITGDRTIEAWVKLDPVDSSLHNQRVINYHHRERSKFTLGLRQEGGKFKIFSAHEDKSVVTANAHVSPEEWSHLAAVYNATNALNLDGQGYVDCGNDVTLDMTEAMTVEAWVTPEKIGSEQVILSKWGKEEKDRSWRLYIDKHGKPCFETRVKDRPISVEDDTSLVSGKSYHLAAAFDASPKKETALEFKGGDNQVEIPHDEKIDFHSNKDFTVTVWIKPNPNNNGNDNMIVEKGYGQGSCPFVIWYTNPNSDDVNDDVKIKVERFAGDKKQSITSNTSVDDEHFHHVAFVKEGFWLYLYIDGLLQDTTDDTTELPTDKSPLLVGSRLFPFTGEINHLRIWDRALSIEEIGQDMDKKYDEVEDAVGHWAFDAKYEDKKVQDRSDNKNHGTLLGDPKEYSFTEVDKCRYEQKIWVDGDLVATHSFEKVVRDDELVLSTNSTRVNIGRSASDEAYFKGIIDDVRLWDIGRWDWQIQYYQDNELPKEAKDLVAGWAFEPGRGKTAIDSKENNHGRLVHPEPEKVEQMWIPAARNARLTLYVNGLDVKTTDDRPQDRGPIDRGSYGASGQFTLGAVFDDKREPKEQLSSLIDEVRVWNAVRTPEQIRDNMYRALTGKEEGLAGYWPLDEGEGNAVEDQTGNGQNGELNEQGWVDSTAPIGNEGPEVRNIYGGQPKPNFNKRIAGPPAAMEYGDMQWDDEGNLFGVMKRGYISQGDALQLVTGFKVGDLELNFIGQIQTAPTLIGYIEGAPPVPSENLTINDPVTDDYVGASTIQLTEAKETTQIYSASRDTGFDMSMDLKAGKYWSTSLSAGGSAGMGAEVSWSAEVFSTEGKVGLHTNFEQSLGYLSNASKTTGTSKTLTKSLTLCGSWEEEKDYDQNGRLRYLNPQVGRRYLPNNMGYALVKSSTADLFALRLKLTGSLVAFQVLPNPDIPEDWNIIMFPLKPKYIKNGTLDGMVGLKPDPDYPNADKGERGSYFKPLEAYALKKRIERESKKIESYYDNFDATAKISTAEDGPLSEVPGAELGYDWETGRDRRNMVNTYVWTADGGFYAEEEQFSSIRQESLGGSYHFLGQTGAYADINLAAGTGFFIEVDALFGGHINTTVSKSKEEKAAFGVHVDVQGEGFINKWDNKKGDYTTDPCPGKVDGYRFMTFYLAPRAQNFDRFFEEIVDPEWLHGQGNYAGEYGANARALREARSKPNEVWRVMHRVTFVSRIPPGNPEDEPTPVESVPKDARHPANIEANIGLLREIERIKYQILSKPDDAEDEVDKDLIILGQAIDRLLGNDQSHSELEKIVSWWAGKGKEVKDEMRQDLMTYLKAFYESGLTPPSIEPEGLQVLYNLEEGKGQIVQDTSGIGEPLNLTIEDPKEVSWIPGGLTINGETLVATSNPASKIIEALKASNEITIETFLKPANKTQSGPARIVTLSADSDNRDFTLAQEGGHYNIRLRTIKTKNNGRPALKAGVVDSDKLSHVVYTRVESGTARLYLNGELADEAKREGDFSTWDAKYYFGLGNEFQQNGDGKDRHWQGELHKVAIYDRALSRKEIEYNYKKCCSENRGRFD